MPEIKLPAIIKQRFVHEDQKWLEKVDNQCEAQSDLPFSFLFSLRRSRLSDPRKIVKLKQAMPMLST